MSAKRFTGKTESDAVMNAAMELGIPSTDLKYTVIDSGSNGFLGLFKKPVIIEIKEEDLKIDVYHSSGAGGQSVNTSNSAVRITHLPTKTVVTCQNERSQLNNKEQAMKMLKNKLYMIEFEKEQAKLNALKGDNSSINFGSQIRSYILEPYKMVKDHRSNYQSNEPEKILDGNIKEMLVYNLKELR